MDERFNYTEKFRVIPLGKFWTNELEPILNDNPAIGVLLSAKLENWVREIRDINPGFDEDLESPIKFDPTANPLKLSFYAGGFGPRFDADERTHSGEISFWRSSDNRFLFSSFWHDLCKTWMPEGNWLRLDTESHSILLEMNRRLVFDPRFYSERSAEYILDMLIVGEPIKNADYQKTSNVVAWLNYHLKWHSRYNLPEVLEKALRHDLPEYLQIMQTFADIEMPPLTEEPISQSHLDNLNAMPAPANRRMI